MIYEISKKILKEVYGGDTKETREKAIKDGYIIEWSKEHIKNVFRFGNGTGKDLKRYMNDNKQYCVFVEI